MALVSQAEFNAPLLQMDSVTRTGVPRRHQGRRRDGSPEGERAGASGSASPTQCGPDCPPRRGPRAPLARQQPELLRVTH